MKLNLPNKITLARIGLIPIVVVLYLVQFPYHEIAAGLVFILCCCTDFIDGNIARKRNMVTDLGKFLDPIADKVIVVIMLFIFIGDGTLGSWYNALIAGVIMSRELIITAFRTIAVQKKVVLAADKWGKIKTVFLDIGLIALTMAGLQTGSIDGTPFFLFWWVGTIAYYIGAFFAIFSGFNYIIKNKQVLKTDESIAPKKTIAQEEKEKCIDEHFGMENKND